MSGSEIRHYSSSEAGEWLGTDTDRQGNNAAPDDDGMPDSWEIAGGLDA